LGDQVWIGPDAEIGPMAVLEDRVFVEGGSTISHSLVGPETFVGRLTDLRGSIAWGRRLMNWRTSSSFEVNEPFLLCALHERHASSERWSWLARLAALGLMVVTLPAGAWVMWRSYLRGKPLLRRKVAICPQDGAELRLDNTLTYYELASANRWLRRWPQLWNVLRGEFSWVGNRPLSPADAAELSEHFERLWLTAPMGLISLADALGCPQAFNDEARAHASFYAVQANWKTDARIFARVLIASLLGVQPRERTAGLPVPFPSEVLKGEG